MKVRKHSFEAKKRRKSLIVNMHNYMKNYATKCRYSFHRMLSI